MAPPFSLILLAFSFLLCLTPSFALSSPVSFQPFGPQGQVQEIAYLEDSGALIRLVGVSALSILFAYYNRFFNPLRRLCLCCRDELFIGRVCGYV